MKPVEETIRVMLVDDHPLMLWGLNELIQGQRPRMEVVGTARSCEEALATIRCLAPNVVLLDLDLAGKNAVDILPALLASWSAHALILTGVRDQTMLDMAVLRGARGVLSKDAPAELVIKAVEKIHQGEMWLDHETLGRVFRGLLNPIETPKPCVETGKQKTLTARERKIIHMLVQHGGMLNKTLAQRLFISEHTLRNHLTSIYQKLGVSNRLELYAYAMKHGLGKSDDGASGPSVGFAIPAEDTSVGDGYART